MTMIENNNTSDSEIIMLDYSPVEPIVAVWNKRAIIGFRFLAIAQMLYSVCNQFFLAKYFKWYFIPPIIQATLSLWLLGEIVRRGIYTKTLIAFASVYSISGLTSFACIGPVPFMKRIPRDIHMIILDSGLMIAIVAWAFILSNLIKYNIATKSNNDSQILDNEVLGIAETKSRKRENRRNNIISGWIVALLFWAITVIEFIDPAWFGASRYHRPWWAWGNFISQVMMFGFFGVLAIRGLHLKMLLCISMSILLGGVLYIYEFPNHISASIFILQMLRTVLAFIVTVLLGYKFLCALFNARGAII